MSQYIALSYTWDTSEYENNRSKKYCVQSWSRNRFRRSKVRNCVFDRIFRYMRHTNVRFLWIDRHCIPQGTCEAACAHGRCAQKRDNIQAMDLVYKLSGHPVALLGRPLWTRAELQLLAKILLGDLVDKVTDLCKAKEALRLLYEITRDSWWGRAWTFQENYRGGERMRLLIRHNPLLEQQKLQHPIFGKIPGELCVQSVPPLEAGDTIVPKAQQGGGEVVAGRHISRRKRTPGDWEIQSHAGRIERHDAESHRRYRSP